VPTFGCAITGSTPAARPNNIVLFFISFLFVYVFTSE
jgi:hypothetical protein